MKNKSTKFKPGDLLWDKCIKCNRYRRFVFIVREFVCVKCSHTTVAPHLDKKPEPKIITRHVDGSKWDDCWLWDDFWFM